MCSYMNTSLDWTYSACKMSGDVIAFVVNYINKLTWLELMEFVFWKCVDSFSLEPFLFNS